MESGSTAVQQTSDVGSNTVMGSGLAAFAPIVLICVLFYFLIMRPQQKREAKKREQLSQLKKGDYVLTNGGVIAKVEKVLNDSEISVEISSGVLIRIYKNFVAEILDASKMQALAAEGTKEQKKEKRVVKRTKKDQPAASSSAGKEE